jgi:membrane fusion protein (multidrug efflux system)
VALLVAGCGQSASESESSSAPVAAGPLAVEGLVVKPQSLSADIRVPGTIMASESTVIHPEVPGRIVELNIREGGYANKGALLAKLYDGDLQAQLRKLEVQLKIAEQTEQRQGELLKIQGISRQDYDLSLLLVQTLKADIDINREAIRKTEIRAPFSGKLGLKNVSPGAYVTSATALTTISQVSNLKIQFNVPERYGALLTNGHPVTFAIDGTDKTFNASVLATEVMIDELTRSLAIRATIRDKDPALIPGAFAEVKIVLGRSDEALMIPSIIVIPQGRKKQVFQYKGGKVLPVEIETGVRDSIRIEVTKGLKTGDTVITSSLLFLRSGMDVEVSRVE